MSAPLAFDLPRAGTDLAHAHFEVWRPPGLTAPRFVLLCADYEDGRHVFDRTDWRAFAEENSAILLRHRLERDTPPTRLAKDDLAAALVLAALRELAARWSAPALATTTPLVFVGLSQAGWQAQALAHRLPARTAAVVAWQPATGKRAPEEAEHPAAPSIPQLLLDAGLETFALRVPELHGAARVRHTRWTYLLRPHAVHHLIGDGTFERAWLRAVLAASASAPSPWRGTWQTDHLSPTDRRPRSPAIAPGPGDATSTWLPDEATARAWLALMSA